MKTNLVKRGDIIIKSFVDHDGIRVNKHPFVVVAVDDNFVTAIEPNALFAAFSMTGRESNFSKNILKNVPVWGMIELTPNDGVKKSSIMPINTITLFADDILPVDKQGEINPDVVKKALKIFELLEQKKLVKYNLNNLPRVVKNKPDIEKLKKESKKETDPNKNKNQLKVK